jgi:uncharacterized protein with PQ loop repeat
MKEMFGIVGMILVQGSTVFQILKFLKSKKTEGVSVIFWWVILAGLLCYLIYALLIANTIYIISNLIGVTLTSVSLLLYYYYKN